VTPVAIKKARKRLGLTQSGLAEALRMGANGGRTVRRWEAGEIPITGPATVAIELLLQRNAT
jgi:DNA-binding transcriptional regulator YiaG